ncbi:hypothetical protein B0J17DRAFT_56869 [Rhizoctonia solani]|nr:hypothetical protein B0J17DRAFT_56869 [Rhizoctonia solani]
MHDPGLLMSIADHLFGVQMVFNGCVPNRCDVHPPVLPAHVPVTLEPISGAPTDGQIIKAQEALRSYQQFSHAPSMFDAHVNMELSQHFFDLQMARYMRRAGEAQPQVVAERASLIQSVRSSPNTSEETTTTGTNNAGKEGNATGATLTPNSASEIDLHDLMERSNQLAERSHQLLERSNELMGRCLQPGDQTGLVSERFNQVFERFTQFLERTRQPTEQSDHLAERFNRLLERLNQLVEQSSESAHRANDLSERSNQLTERANQLTEHHNELSGHSNQLTEKATKPVEAMGDLLKNINRVLVGIQHAIVRSHKGNTVYAVDCLVNEKGQTPMEGLGRPFKWNQVHSAREAIHHLPVRISGDFQDSYLYNVWLGPYLRFHGIGERIREGATSSTVKAGKEKEAREMLSDYLSSCLG